MDKLLPQLLTLLRDLLDAYRRLVILARARQQALRAYDLGALNALLEREQLALGQIQALEARRRDLTVRLQAAVGGGARKPVAVSDIAARCAEPTRSQLLGLAGELKAVAGELEALNRLNGRVSQAVLRSLARVLKIVTGMAHHAGLYMRNGRKAAVHGIHLLDAVA